MYWAGAPVAYDMTLIGPLRQSTDGAYVRMIRSEQRTVPNAGLSATLRISQRLCPTLRYEYAQWKFKVEMRKYRDGERAR